LHASCSKRTDGQTDGEAGIHDEASSRFSKLWEPA